MALGRPPKVVDLPKLVELSNAGLAVREIAEELGVSRSVVNRMRAQNKGSLSVKRRAPKPVAATIAMITTLDQRDRAIVMYALGCTIEREIVALDRCQQLRSGFGVTEAIHCRERTLVELRRTRQRLLTRV